MSDRKTIPMVGRAREILLAEMQDLRCDDVRYREGRTWSLTMTSWSRPTTPSLPRMP
jgi:hypothetical protein